jgi:hypothetical protein
MGKVTQKQIVRYLENLADNVKIVESFDESLLEEYNNHFVAIHDKRVVAYDRDLDSLIKTLKEKKVFEEKDLYIEFISKDSVLVI